MNTAQSERKQFLADFMTMVLASDKEVIEIVTYLSDYNDSIEKNVAPENFAWFKQTLDDLEKVLFGNGCDAINLFKSVLEEKSESKAEVEPMEVVESKSKKQLYKNTRNCTFPYCQKFGHYQEILFDGVGGQFVCSQHAGLDKNETDKLCFIGNFIKGTVKPCLKCDKTAIFAPKSTCAARYCADHREGTGCNYDVRLFKCKDCRRTLNIGINLCYCGMINNYF
jgi:hypothetical protein